MYNIKFIYSGFVFGKFLSFSKNKQSVIKIYFKIYKKQIKNSFNRIKLKKLIYNSILYFKINLNCFIFINVFIYVITKLYFYNFFI